MRSKIRKKCLSLITISVIVILANTVSGQQDTSWTLDRSASSSSKRQIYIDQCEKFSSCDKSVLTGYQKFVLLTTGKQVKLYPLSDDNQPSETYFFIKLYNDLRYNSEKLINAERNRTSTRKDSILPMDSYGTKKKSSTSLSSRVSIIPASDQSGDADNFMTNDQGGTKDYWIQDINYFYEQKNDGANFSEYFVIFWLDIVNQKIGYANIDLRLVTSGQRGHQTLWAEPVQMIDTKQVDTRINKQYSALPTTELVFDEIHRALYANLYDWRKHHYKLLKINLQEARITNEPRLELIFFPANNPRNFNLDHNDGDRLFCFDYIGRTERRMLIGDLHYGIRIPRAINHYDFKVSNDTLDNEQRFGISSPAPDFGSNRIYWLTAQNELKSCDFSGDDTRVVSRLPARPLIKEPGRTEIVQGSFYFSDSKRRLFYHNLPSESQKNNISLYLLLIEDPLENFRIGFKPTPTPTPTPTPHPHIESMPLDNSAQGTRDKSLKLQGIYSADLFGNEDLSDDEDENIYFAISSEVDYRVFGIIAINFLLVLLYIIWEMRRKVQVLEEGPSYKDKHPV